MTTAERLISFFYKNFDEVTCHYNASDEKLTVTDSKGEQLIFIIQKLQSQVN